MFSIFKFVVSEGIIRGLDETRASECKHTCRLCQNLFNNCVQYNLYCSGSTVAYTAVLYCKPVANCSFFVNIVLIVVYLSGIHYFFLAFSCTIEQTVFSYTTLLHIRKEQYKSVEIT